MEFYRTEVDSCGNIEKANKAFDFSIKKICELIYCKRLDLFKVVYVFKEEYLEQFTQEEKKQILSSV